jgi:hypothetical protein
MTATSKMIIKKSLPISNHLFPVVIPVHEHFPRQSSNHPKIQKNQKKKYIFEKSPKTLNNAPFSLIRIPQIVQNSTATSNLALKTHQPVPNHLFPFVIPVHEHFPRQSSKKKKFKKKSKKKKLFNQSKTLNNAPFSLIRIPLLTQNSTATSNLALKTHPPVPNHLFPVIIPVHQQSPWQSSNHPKIKKI